MISKSSARELEVVDRSPVRQVAALTQQTFGRSTLSRNIFWLVSSATLTVCVNALINFLLARKLGVRAFGEWSLILASASWILMWQTAVGSDLIRKAAQDTGYGRRAFGQSMVILLVGSALLGGVSVLLNFALIHKSGTVAPSILAVFAIAATAATAISTSLFMGRDRMEWNFAASTQSLLLFLALLALSTKGLTVGTVAKAYLVTSLIVAIPVVLAASWIVKPSRWGGKELLQSSIVDVGQLFAVNWLYMLHWTLDLYLLQFLRGAADVGIYNAAFKLVILSRILPSLILMSVIPETARRTAAADFACLRRVWMNSTRVLLLLGGALVLAALVFANSLVRVAYSAAYTEAITVLMILSLAVFPIFSQVVIQSLFFAAGRYIEIIKAVTAGIVMQVIGGFVLIPYLGPKGAAIAFVIAECAILGCLLAFSVRVLGRPSGAAVIGKVLLASFASVCVALIGLRLHVIPSVLLASIITLYFTLSYSLGCISVRDLSFGRSILQDIVRGSA